MIQVLICRFQQVREVSMLTPIKLCNSEAGGYIQVPGTAFERRRTYFLPERFSEFNGRCQISFDQQDAKFLAAKAAKDLPGFALGLDSLGKFLEHFIARQMAMRVIK